MLDEPFDEAERIRRARAGDEDALSELLVRHGPIVRQALAIPERWRSVLDLDEVMQAAYYKAFLGIAAFEPRGENAFQRWLAILARNSLRDELKKLTTQKRGGDLRRIDTVRGEEGYVALYERVAVHHGTPSRSAGRAEIELAVRNAIALLPMEMREIVRLRDLEGLTFDAVAERTKRSATTVRNLHREACGRLRDLLETASKYPSGPG